MSSPELQARLWLGVVRTSVMPADQANAYQQAAECLTGMFSQCYVLVDYAEWLVAHRFPAQQARDALHSAADALLRVRGSADDEDGGGGGGGGAQSVASSTILRKSSGALSGGASRQQQIALSPHAGSTARGGGTVTRQSAAGTSRIGASTGRSGAVSRAGASTVAGGDAAGGSTGDWPTVLEAAHIDLLVSRGRETGG